MSIPSPGPFLSDLRRTFTLHKPALLSSTTARLLTILVLNPLDASKARLQTSVATSPLALRAVSRGPPLAGLTPALLAHAPAGLLAFLLYSRFTASLAKSNRAPWLPVPIAAACLADTLTALWLAPLETVKLRVQTAAFPSAVSALRAGALWNGVVAQVARDVPCRVLHLLLYERARALYERRTGAPIGVRDGAATGAVVGAVVGALTNPLDVIKTRVMAQRAPPGRTFQGWVGCAVKSISKEGSGVLWRGVRQRSVYMALSVALFSAAYEAANKVWREKMEVAAAQDGGSGRRVGFVPAGVGVGATFVDALGR